MCLHVCARVQVEHLTFADIDENTRLILFKFVFVVWQK